MIDHSLYGTSCQRSIKIPERCWQITHHQQNDWADETSGEPTKHVNIHCLKDGMLKPRGGVNNVPFDQTINKGGKVKPARKNRIKGENPSFNSPLNQEDNKRLTNRHNKLTNNMVNLHTFLSNWQEVHPDQLWTQGSDPEQVARLEDKIERMRRQGYKLKTNHLQPPVRNFLLFGTKLSRGACSERAFNGRGPTVAEYYRNKHGIRLHHSKAFCLIERDGRGNKSLFPIELVNVVPPGPPRRAPNPRARARAPTPARHQPESRRCKRRYPSRYPFQWWKPVPHAKRLFELKRLSVPYSSPMDQDRLQHPTCKR